MQKVNFGVPCRPPLSMVGWEVGEGGGAADRVRGRGVLDFHNDVRTCLSMKNSSYCTTT